MPSPRSASAFSSFTTICSGVCFENFLMVIHSARPHTARTTQNNPLKTNGPKNPDPSISAGAAYTVGQYLSESDSSNLTLFVCPDMGYRYAHILEGTQISSHIVRAPRWIATLDELAPPWCTMEWNGTPFTQTPTSTHKRDNTDG